DAGVAAVLVDGDRGHAFGQTHNIDRNESIGFRAVAELPLVVSSPAFDAAAVRERARVAHSRDDGRDAALQPDDVDGREAIRELRSVAHLAEVVVAPTFHTASVCKGTGVAVSRRNRQGA